MRVRVIRTPGELRDTIGHKVMIRKGWEGEVVDELSDDDKVDAGYHPLRHETVYSVLFDDWGQPVAIPSNHLVEIDEEDARESD